MRQNRDCSFKASEAKKKCDTYWNTPGIALPEINPMNIFLDSQKIRYVILLASSHRNAILSWTLASFV